MFFNRNSPVFTNYFKDKRFVITGGASGLGLQLAEDICSYGGSVTLISRNIEKLEKARNLVLGKYHEASINYYQADVSDTAQMIEVFKMGKYQRMSSTDDDDFNMAMSSRDRATGEDIYTQFYGDLFLEDALEEEISKEEQVIENIEEIEEILEDDEEIDQMYLDTLPFLSDKKSQEIMRIDGFNSPYSFKYVFIFNDFIDCLAQRIYHSSQVDKLFPDLLNLLEVLNSRVF